MAVAACLLLAAPAALADGDPASDYLLTYQAFVPPDDGIPPAYANQLTELLTAERKAGYTIRVALIGTRYDMGSVVVLYRMPKQYARFLGQELFFVYKGRLLVVMPNGYGGVARRQGAAGAAGAHRPAARSGRRRGAAGDGGDTRRACAGGGVGSARRAPAAPRVERDEHEPGATGNRRRRCDLARARRRVHAAQAAPARKESSMSRSRSALVTALAVLAVVCAGCGSSKPTVSGPPPSPYTGFKLNPPMPAPAFNLHDQAGKLARLAVRAGPLVRRRVPLHALSRRLPADREQPWRRDAQASRPARARDQRRSEGRHAGGRAERSSASTACPRELPLPDRYAGAAGAGLEEVPHRRRGRPERDRQPQRVRAARRPEGNRGAAVRLDACGQRRSSTTCRCSRRPRPSAVFASWSCCGVGGLWVSGCAPSGPKAAEHELGVAPPRTGCGRARGGGRPGRPR